MSEIVHYSGKLTKVTFSDSSLPVELKCKKILDEHGIEESDFYDSYKECLEYELYQKYVVIDDDVYSADYEDASDDDIFKASKINDDSIKFEIKYYNGCLSFSNAIRKAIEQNIV